MVEPEHKFAGCRRAAIVLLCCILAAMVLSVGTSAAGDRDARRINIGIDLFSSFLAADMDIREKAGADGRLHLVFVYNHDEQGAVRLVRQLEKVGEIRGLPIRTRIVGAGTLRACPKKGRVAGVFVTERLGKALRDVIECAKKHRALVFSPFEGDLEKGASAGLHVSDRILPYVNLSAVESAGIRLKSFFLKVAKRHE